MTNDHGSKLHRKALLGFLTIKKQTEIGLRKLKEKSLQNGIDRFMSFVFFFTNNNNKDAKMSTFDTYYFPFLFHLKKSSYYCLVFPATELKSSYDMY